MTNDDGNHGFVYRRLPFKLCLGALAENINVWTIQKQNPDLANLIRECRKTNRPAHQYPIVDSILLLAYPIENGKLNTSVTLGCVHVNPRYTIYERLEGEEEEEEEDESELEDTESLFLMDDGALNPITGERKKGRMKKLRFNSENDAVEYTKKHGPYTAKGCRKKEGTFKRLYDNHHHLLDEFVERASLAGNYCHNHPSVRSNITDENGNVFCSKCAKSLNEEETYMFADNNVLDFSRLIPGVEASSTAGKSTFRFTNDVWVDREFLYFGETDDLPFLPKLTNRYSEQFVSTVKHTCYDIETVVRKNPYDENRSTDEIVAISVVSYEGMKKMSRAVYMSSKMPDFKSKKSEYFLADCPDGFVDIPIREKKLQDKLGHNEQMNENRLRTELISARDQSDLVYKFVELLEKERPAILTHFNGLGFDSKMIVRGYLHAGIKDYVDDDWELGKKINENYLYDRLSPLNIKKSRGMVKSTLRSQTRSLKRMAPGADHEHGMIRDNVLVMDYLDFQAMVQVDVMLGSTSTGVESLNTLSAKKLGVHKIDLPYTQITEKFDKADPLLAEYAMMDTLLTTLLFTSNAQLFELYFQRQKIFGCPWDYTIGGKQSVQTKLLRYRYEHMLGSTSPMSIRPKGSLGYLVYAKNVALMFLNGFDPSNIDKNDYGTSLQLCKDFTNGHCKLNTYLKNMRKTKTEYDSADWDETFEEAKKRIENESRDPYEPLYNVVLVDDFDSSLLFSDDSQNNHNEGRNNETTDEPARKRRKNYSETFTLADAKRSVDVFFLANRSCFTEVNTMHLMAMLWNLICPENTKSMLAPFKEYRQKFAQKYDSQHLELFDEFLIYLLTVRRNLGSMSPFEEVHDFMKQYNKYHKMVTRGQFEWLADFAEDHIFTVNATEAHHLTRRKTINLDFLRKIYDTEVPFRRCVDRNGDEEKEAYSAIVDYIVRKTKKIEIGSLPYDGAVIVPADTGIARTPACFLDIESEYPNAIVASNIGNGCKITLDQVLEAGDALKDVEDYRMFTTKRCDDFKNWKDFPEEFQDCVRFNAFFIVREHKWESSIRKAIKKVMADRFKDKRKGEEFYEKYENELDPEKKEYFLKMSNYFTGLSTAKKIALNSIYGNLPYLMESGFRGIVTTVGRMITQSMIAECKRIFKSACTIIYGDTDSVVVCLIVDVDLLLEGDAAEAAKALNPDGNVLTKSDIEKARKFSEDFCRKKGTFDDKICRRVKMQEGIFNQTVIPYMNEKMWLKPHMRIGKTKETFYPFVIPSAKMYCGLNPSDGYSTFTKGMSLKKSRTTGLQRSILHKFMTTIQEVGSEPESLATVINTMYHFVGHDILDSLKDTSKIDLDKMVAVPMAINKSKVVEDSKSHHLLMRLRDEGNESAFESEKLRVVPVETLCNENGDWSVATVHQILSQNLQLNKRKIMKDNLSEFGKLISSIPQLSPPVFDLFNEIANLQYFEKVCEDTIRKLIVKKPEGVSNRDFKSLPEYRAQQMVSSKNITLMSKKKLNDAKNLVQERSAMNNWLKCSEENKLSSFLRKTKRAAEDRTTRNNKRLKRTFSSEKKQMTIQEMFNRQ